MAVLDRSDSEGHSSAEIPLPAEGRPPTVIPPPAEGRSPTEGPPPRSGAVQRTARALRAPLSALAAAWLLPLAATAAHLGLLVPLAMWLGVAALLRVGHTLLDRLVIAAGVLAALLIVEGLLFSVWPWGLSPVPVGGTTLTVLVAVGAWTRRNGAAMPRIPWRVRGSDLIVLGAPAVLWPFVSRQTAGKPFAVALNAAAATPDAVNHFALFDGILRFGGYPFFKNDRALPVVATMQHYPPGSHLLAAVMDVFRTGSTDPGDARHELLRFHQYAELSACLMVLAIVWATRWIAGPLATGWHRTLVCAVVGALAVFGQLPELFWEGFFAECLGLTLLAVTVAVVVRPPSHVREQILVGAALFAATVAVYPIFAIAAGACGVGALLVFKMRIRQAVFFAAAAAGAAAALAVLIIGQSFEVPGKSHILTEAGSFIAISRPLSLAFGLIALSALATDAGRRLPAWRIMAGGIVGSWAVALWVEEVGREATGAPTYYSSKFVSAAFVVTLCGFGAIALHLKPIAKTGGTGARRLAARMAPGALSIAFALAMAHGFPGATNHAGLLVPDQTSPAIQWANGKIFTPAGVVLADYARVGPVADSVPTILIAGGERGNDSGTVAALAALNHTLGMADLRAFDSRVNWATPSRVPGVDLAWITLDALSPGTTEATLTSDQTAAWSKVRTWLDLQSGPLRVAVTNQPFAALLAGYATSHPQMSVLYVPTYGKKY